jgi:hypothetical protein
MIRFLADASLHHAIVSGCLRRELGIPAKLNAYSERNPNGIPG